MLNDQQIKGYKHGYSSLHNVNLIFFYPLVAPLLSSFTPYLGNVHRCAIHCHLKFSWASNLVYIRVIPRVRQDVKACVNIIEQVDYLDGSLSRGVLAAEGVESHDAAEEDGHVVVALCRHRPFVTQLVGNGWRQNGIKQSKKRGRDGHFEADVMSSGCEEEVQLLDLCLISSSTTFWSFFYRLQSNGRVVFLW